MTKKEVKEEKFNYCVHETITNEVLVKILISRQRKIKAMCIEQDKEGYYITKYNSP